jgi:glycerol-3-phosphate dehydrogenase (NAD(P)+)
MNQTGINRIGIIGGGAWGTALAMAAVRAGRRAVLWAREAEVVESINGRHENSLFLPGVTLDPAIAATGDLAAAAHSDALLLVTPAQHLRSAARALRPHLAAGTPVVICAKGIELESGLLLSEVVAAELPGTPFAVLTGPTFAIEVAKALPTAITLAAADAAIGRALVNALGGSRFRPYLSDDPIGAQIGGAVKNVLAIACGVVEGRQLGDNARAALVTRGLAEMVRLGVALGGKAETLMGLSGLGDLTLTCTSLQSRNTSLGVQLGQGRALADILAERRSVAEGVTTARAVLDLAARRHVDMPICHAVKALLDGAKGIDAVMEGLLARPFKTETQ